MDIKALLKKKSLTGKEVGQALITNLLSETVYKKELMTQADLRALEQKIKTSKDSADYAIYSEIFRDIINNGNICQAHKQQFYNSYTTNTKIVVAASKADTARQILEGEALILADKEYQLYFLKAHEKLAADKMTFHNIMIRLLKKILSAKKIPKVLKPIKQDLEATKDKELPPVYGLIKNYGYYELADGRRSDQLSKEKWEKALKELCTITGRSDKHTRQMELCKLLYDGAPAVKKEFKKATGKELKSADKEIITALDQIIGGLGFYTPLAALLDQTLCGGNIATWQPYPLDLNKFNFIYYNIYSEPQSTIISALKLEYKTVYKALEAYIKEKLLPAANLKANQYDKPFITYGELEKKKLYGAAGLTEPQDKDIIEQYKAKNPKDKRNYKGVAILTNKIYDVYHHTDPLEHLEDIEKLSQDKDRIELLSIYNARMIKSYKYIQAYNQVLIMLEQIYKIDNIVKLATVDMTDLKERIDIYNNTIYTFYWGANTEKTRQQIKKAIAPVDTRPLKKNQEQFTKVLLEFKKNAFTPITSPIYKNLAYYINLLRV